jgi:F-type H+-transporting ATPase subunit b
MRSWLMIGVVSILLAGTFAPLRVQAAGHDEDSAKLKKVAEGWNELTDKEREQILDELTRKLSGKDKEEVRAFFKDLPNKAHEEAYPPIGVENGLFRGALEVSLWTIIVFLLLMRVLRKYAWGPILAGLQTREEGIARDKSEAEQARRLATEARAKADEELKRVHAEINQMIAKARQDAQQTAEEEIARGKAQLQAERDRLHRELETARDQALQQIWGQAAQLATLISSKAIGKQLREEDHRALLDEALKEFRAAGRERLEDVESAKA